MKIVLLLLSFAVNAYASGNYSTTFPLTENPISENSNWINGATVGLDWSNVQAINGHASGTQVWVGNYNDSTAVLSGVWGTNQTAQATVVAGNSWQNSVEEVELRLRTSISAHSITGYEFDFRVQSGSGGTGYINLVKWNGPLNSFTQFASANNNYAGIKTGDVIKATVVGNLFSAYVNGVLVAQGTDSTYTGGSPGVGFWMSQGGNNNDFGLTNFSATDGGSPTPTPSPNPTPTPTPTPPPAPAATLYTPWETSLISELQSLRINNTNINKIQAWLKANPPYP